jgi:TM2 domain-containing membrane protein YozV
VKGIGALVRKRLVALAAAIVLAVLVLIPVVAVGAVQFLVGLLPDRGFVAHRPRLVGRSARLAGDAGHDGGGHVPGSHQSPHPVEGCASGGCGHRGRGLLAAFGVGQYLGGFGSGSSTFGVLGGMAILLFFFNLMWVVYLFGAEVTKVYADYLEFGDVGRLMSGPSPASQRRSTRRFVPKAAGTAWDVNASVFAFLAGLFIGRRKNR